MDDYLDFCRRRGESPDKPMSGRFVLRVGAELHRRLGDLARASGQSLNQWIVSRLQKEAEGPGYDQRRAQGRTRPTRGKSKKRETAKSR